MNVLVDNRNPWKSAAIPLSVVEWLFVLFVFPIHALAQDGSVLESTSRELLHPVGDHKRAVLMERYAYDVAILEYFAMPGTLGLYEFDLSALEIEGETITISPNNIDPIKILSHGIEVNWIYGGKTARWRGEIPVPNTDVTMPVTMSILIRAVDEHGEIKWPDPNQEVTRSALEGQNYVVLEESKKLLNEQILYGLFNSFIQVPRTRTTIRIGQLGESLDSFGTVLVYEIDDSKTVIPGDDSPINPTPPTPDMVRRAEAFKKHEDRVRREFGMPPREEF